MDSKALAASPSEPSPINAPASGILRILTALGPARIVALGAVALVLAAFFAFVILRATEQPYTLLFSGLELRNAQELVGRLEAMGVPYRLTASGDAIMVPSGDALRLRMTLAEEGLPVGRTVGYELFDTTNPFTTTDFMADVNLRRATEGELARTIGSLRAVRSARVHIVEPRQTPFNGDRTAPSASIVLSLSGSGQLGRSQVRAIQQLVAGAVPRLRPEAVAVVDDQGGLLAEAREKGANALGVGDAEEHVAAYEERLRSKLVQILERTVGVGHVEVVVTADLDFDSVATTNESFDPASQVVRSTQTSEEASSASHKEDQTTVTVANNLPTERTGQDGTAGNKEDAKHTEETINYEISRTVQNQTKALGVVRRLSIAVQVDCIYNEQPDGTRSYEARSPEELEQLRRLVRSAAGVSDERGDVLEIVNRPFAPPEAGPAPDIEPLGLAPDSWWRLADLGTLVVCTVLVLIFGVRPLVRRLLPDRPVVTAAAETSVVVGTDGKPLLVHAATGAAIGVDSDGHPLVVREPAATAGEAGDATATSSEAAVEMIDLRRVRGQVRASLVHDVARIIDQHPEDALRVVRTWLHGG